MNVININHYIKQNRKQATPAFTFPQTNNPPKTPQDDKIKTLRQELKALKDKFNKITQLLKKMFHAKIHG